MWDFYTRSLRASSLKLHQIDTTFWVTVTFKEFGLSAFYYAEFLALFVLNAKGILDVEEYLNQCNAV